MALSKRCVATTKAGKRCKNRVKNGTFCSRHPKSAKISLIKPLGKWEKVGLGVGIAAGSTQLIEQIIKIVKFDAEHCQKIKPLVQYYSAFQHWDNTTRHKRRKFSGMSFGRRCELLLQQRVISESDLRKLSKSLDQWLKDLPPSVRIETLEHFGTHHIDKLRRSLRTMSY